MMTSLGKLLVIIDPDQDSQPALDKALKLSKMTGAALELLICDYNSYLEDGRYFDPPQARELRREHIERNRGLLADMAAVVSAQGFKVSTDVLWGNPPWERIIEKVEESAPDMVIQSTRHHELIARLLLSHQDWELIRHCPCPLLLVKDQEWGQKPVFVIAIDPLHRNDKPAELDLRLLAMGRDLAQASGGELRLFHSYYQPPVAGIYPVEMDEDYFREKAQPLLQESGISEDKLKLSAKDIQHALPAFMEEVSGDVLVMGAISRSRLDRFFIGNTAEKLLDRIKQDVLVIKPPHFEKSIS